jgi:hypothetical protein
MLCDDSNDAAFSIGLTGFETDVDMLMDMIDYRGVTLG